ncbi:L,D-transpeptidase family protein [Paenibacillus roseipurpureus]|uniref:L,D-transpeptidase n=1 Tax=Paenibacillus roseopurpureus TaxID=2918901 RepID=A0AA96LJR8_9BACL|nr:L,D-transpeptidase [Paenibacillus sp. MBLB1832]WNR43172.1 L,D-transpeptidase [Paenibacillus sp. MBLB1832]
MKRNQRNEQLERFFQHNPIEDPMYLKKYVKDHPNHKMAWYLLGREYTAQGKAGKAAYCFAQAGEIYEAFEQQTIRLEDAPALLKQPEAVKRRRGGKRRLLALLVMFLLITLVAGQDFANTQGREQALSVQEEAKTETIAMTPQSSGVAHGQSLVYSDGEWGKQLQQIVQSSSGGSEEVVLIEASGSKGGQWKEWHRSLKPILSVTKPASAGSEAALKYYNSQTCACQAVDGSSLQPAISSWMREREEAIVLQSAIGAYLSKMGVLPDQSAQLTKPYPDNLLPGLTPQMKEGFAAAVARLKAAALPTVDSSGSKGETGVEKPAGSSTANPAQSPEGSVRLPASAAAPLVEPLRIVIDTEQHQLAVVSGTFILRRYPVGLGGSKTPQGDFIISEKVRNPNGKSNGEFGSRGMTLSNTLYAIHGTNKPSSIGKDESHGCVRMLQADLEELYDMVPQTTKVTIGKGVLPESTFDPGSGLGAGSGDPKRAIQLPLETKDNNPKKTYKWLD